MKRLSFLFLLFFLTACAGSGAPTNYHDPTMDFASLRSVAVMPFVNLTRDNLAADRARDTFMNSLLATGAFYVVPSGEVARGIARAGIQNPAAPSGEEIAKLASIIKVDAVITGAVLEYGELRSGTTSANVVSLDVQMVEAQKQKVVWTASSTKGGISFWDRLLGGGGQPMNDVTKAATDDLINKLFQ